MNTNLDKKLKRLNWAIHGLGLVAVLAGAGIVQLTVYCPIDREHSVCTARRAELENLLSSADEIRQTHDQLTERRDETRLRAAHFKERIPEEPREAEFLQQVSELAHDVGLQIRDYRPGVATALDSYSQLEVVLSCDGRYDSICGFLDRLTELPRLASAARVEIVSQPNGDNYPVTMTLVIYFGVRKESASNLAKT